MKRGWASRNFHKLASLRLEKLARQSQRHADADYRRKIGLGVLECRVIGIVGSQGPLSLRELCLGTDIEKTYASRLVAKLTHHRLIEKSLDSLDHRSFVIAVTKAGRQMYNRIYRIALLRNERWLAALLPEHREIFFDCLKTLELTSRKLLDGSKATRTNGRNALTRSANSVHQTKPREAAATRSRIKA